MSVKSISSTESEVILPDDDLTKYDKHDIIFDPPLYYQRYATVQNILMNPIFNGKIKKVADFGCSEFGFSYYVKNIDGIRKVFFIDIDKELLENHSSRLYPLNIDYLKRRTESFDATVLCGSVSNPDYRLVDVDAVICIELIEHLYPNILEALPYNIFGIIRPLVAIFTTPNADFNVLFPHFSGSRHWDHKFEWSRQQFQDWAFNITKIYPEYSVAFEGIGRDPWGSVNYGECSQMAVFRRMIDKEDIFDKNSNSCMFCKYELDFNLNVSSYGMCSYMSPVTVNEKTDACDHKKIEYEQIAFFEYPFEVDTRTKEEKILHNAIYKINQFSGYLSCYFNEENERAEIPFHELISNDSDLQVTEEELSKLLKREGYKIQECNIQGSPTLCVLYSPFEMSKSSHKTVSESSGNNFAQETYSECSDWNDESDCLTYDISFATDLPQSRITDDLATLKNTLCNDVLKSENKDIGETSGATSPKQLECLYDSGLNQISSSSIELLSPELLKQISYNKNDKTEFLRAKSEPDSFRCNKTQVVRRQVNNNTTLNNPVRLTPNRSDGTVKTVKPIVNMTNDEVGESAAPADVTILPVVLQNTDVQNNNNVTTTSTNIPPVQPTEPEAENVNLENFSQEVLFDTNSNNNVSEVDVPQNQNRQFYNLNSRNPLDIVSVHNRENAFPTWLLHLLNMSDEDSDSVLDTEAHFYSQGDGLGIHPSLSELSTDSSTTTNGSVHMSNVLVLAQSASQPTVPETDANSDDYFSVVEAICDSLPVQANADTQENQSSFEVAVEMTESQLQMLKEQGRDTENEDKFPEQSTSKKKD